MLVTCTPKGFTGIHFDSSLIILSLKLYFSSLDIMEHPHCGHESAHARFVVLAPRNFTGFVEDSVELSNLVAHSDFLEKFFDCFLRTRLLEVPL